MHFWTAAVDQVMAFPLRCVVYVFCSRILIRNAIRCRLKKCIIFLQVRLACSIVFT